MNDTIVVFDRVRENMNATRGESLTAVVNLCVNQTLSRTFITTGTTLHRHGRRHLLRVFIDSAIAPA